MNALLLSVLILVALAILVVTIIILVTVSKNKEKFRENFKGAYSFANVYKEIIPQRIVRTPSGAMMAIKAPSGSALAELKTRVDKYKPMKDNSIDKDGNVIKHADEVYLKVCCQLALRSVALGNFGIGVVIADPKLKLKPHLQNATVLLDDGSNVHYLSFVKKMLQSLGYPDPDSDPYLSKIVGVGLNQIFYSGYFGTDGKPHVRSDRHGEMVSMDLLEDAISSVPYEKDFQTRMPEGLELYTQLESCPMCMARLASSSISAVYHGAPDNGGGMVHKLCDLPPIFIGLTNVQKYAPASISGNLGGPNGKKNALIQICFDCFGINVGTVGTKQNNRAYGCQTTCPQMKYCRPTTSPEMVKRAGYNLSGFIRY